MNVWERKCGCDPTDHVKMFWWLEWGVYWTMRKMTPTEMIRLDQIQTTHGAKKIFAKNKKKEAKCAKLWKYQNLKIRQGKREDRWILIGIKREPIVVGAERERGQRWLNFQGKLFKCGWTFEHDIGEQHFTISTVPAGTKERSHRSVRSRSAPRKWTEIESWKDQSHTRNRENFFG